MWILKRKVCFYKKTFHMINEFDQKKVLNRQQMSSNQLQFQFQWNQMNRNRNR